MKKIVSLISIFVIIASMLCAFCACNDTGENHNVEADAIDLEECTSIQGVSLAMVDTEAVSASEDSLTRRVRANVYPEDAANKEVDWSVAWYNNKGLEGEASDYVTVTPDYDGSNDATITCIKNFPLATIGLIAVTRLGGFRAAVECTYSGAAMTFTINYEESNTYDNAVVENYDKDNPLKYGSSTRTVYNILDYERHETNIHFWDVFGVSALDSDEINIDVKVNLVGSFKAGLYLEKFEGGLLDLELISSELKDTRIIDSSTMFSQVADKADTYANGYDEEFYGSRDYNIAKNRLNYLVSVEREKAYSNTYAPKHWYYRVQPISSWYTDLVSYSEGDENGYYQILAMRYLSAAESDDIYMPFFEVSITYKDTTVKLNLRGMYTSPTSVELDTESIVF